MKIKFIFSALIWLIFYAISNCQAVLNTTGASVLGNNFIVNYSIGEISTATVGTPSIVNFVTAGVIQPEYFLVDATSESFDEQYSLTAYPNPVAQQLTIETDFEDFRSFAFFNLAGQKAFHGDFNYSPIALTWMPAGTYFLTLASEDQKVSKTIKIIKQ